MSVLVSWVCFIWRICLFAIFTNNLAPSPPPPPPLRYRVNSKQLNRTAVLVQKAMDKNTPLFLLKLHSLKEKVNVFRILKSQFLLLQKKIGGFFFKLAEHKKPTSRCFYIMKSSWFWSLQPLLNTYFERTLQVLSDHSVAAGRDWE